MLNEYERFAKLLVLELESEKSMISAIKGILPLMENTHIKTSVEALLDDLYCGASERDAFGKFHSKCNIPFFAIFPALVEEINSKLSLRDGIKILNLLVNEKFMFGVYEGIYR